MRTQRADARGLGTGPLLLLAHSCTVGNAQLCDSPYLQVPNLHIASVDNCHGDTACHVRTTYNPKVCCAKGLRYAVCLRSARFQRSSIYPWTTGGIGPMAFYQALARVLPSCRTRAANNL